MSGEVEPSPSSTSTSQQQQQKQPSATLPEVLRTAQNTQKLMAELTSLLDKCEEAQAELQKARASEQSLLRVNQQFQEMAQEVLGRTRDARKARSQLSHSLERQLAALVRQKEATVAQTRDESIHLNETILKQDIELRDVHRKRQRLELMLRQMEVPPSSSSSTAPLALPPPPLPTTATATANTTTTTTHALTKEAVAQAFSTQFDPHTEKAHEFLHAPHTEFKDFLAHLQPTYSVTEAEQLLSAGDFQSLSLEEVPLSAEMIPSSSPAVAASRYAHLTEDDLRQITPEPEPDSKAAGLSHPNTPSSTTLGLDL